MDGLGGTVAGKAVPYAMIFGPRKAAADGQCRRGACQAT